MRPIADIISDLEADAPPCDSDAWDAFLDRVTPAELSDESASGWLELTTAHRAHEPLRIPSAIAADPRLTSPQRFVLAALLDVARDVDTACAEAEAAVVARLFGTMADAVDRAVASEAIAGLVALGVLTRTTRGGFVRVT